MDPDRFIKTHPEFSLARLSIWLSLTGSGKSSRHRTNKFLDRPGIMPATIRLPLNMVSGGVPDDGFYTGIHKPWFIQILDPGRDEYEFDFGSKMKCLLVMPVIKA